MPRITSKGQVTIPQEIREKFGLLPGMEVRFITEENKAIIVKNTQENTFLKWLGHGGRQKKESVDTLINAVRGRTDE